MRHRPLGFEVGDHVSLKVNPKRGVVMSRPRSRSDPIGESCDAPKPGGPLTTPSTRGIQVEVGLPDATLENRAESPLYGELYPITVLV